MRISTETHVKLDQIHHIRNNWLGPSNDRVLCVYVPSGHSTRKQLASGRFFQGLQNYMKNKNEGNENKK